MQRIVLIDGHSILNRAFYGIPPLTNTEGLHTNAVYGFLNIMFKIIDTEKPYGIAVAFDRKEPTFRHERYAEYKGTRKPMPEELHEQVPLTQQMLTAMGIPVITKAGYEADDIIGTLAKKYQRDGYEVTVVSGDRDLLQLTDTHIKVLLPKTVKGQTTVTEYTPETVKQDFGIEPMEIIDLKALMGDSSDNIPGLPGVGEKTATAIISQYHTIENAKEHAAEIKPPRASKALMEDYEKAVLSKWLATICLDAPVSVDETEIVFTDPYTPDAFALCRRLNFQSFLKRFEGHTEDAETFDPDENVILEEDGITYVSDLKPLLHKKRITEGQKTFDIGIAQYLINPLAKPQNHFDMPTAKKYLQQIRDAGMTELYESIEMPLVCALADMEEAGIRVDGDALKSYSDELQISIDQLEKEILEECGESFNLNSPKQLGVILFEKMGLKGGKKTKTGYSTSADVLEKLAVDNHVVRKILEYRALTKLNSTYAEGLRDYIGEDGRIHGQFHQTITATGRISSTDPNLQNIPVRTAMGSRIREVFVPEDGYVFVDADYSQIELRILASLSGDEALISSYRNAVDIHTVTASNVFHVPQDQVTPELRRSAKAVNFGVVYGISAFGLGEDLGISRREAQEYINDYFKTYPGVKEYLDSQIRYAKQNGYVKTLYGRRRPIPELVSSNFMQRQFGERVAMNSPIQGTAADIMKIAMIRVREALREKAYDARIVLQVHDELLIEVRREQAEEVKALLMEVMKHAADLSVTLEVDAHIGGNWLEAKG